jgi:hypothetical protein
LARQNRDAEERRQASRPAVGTAVAVPDNRTYLERWLDDVAPTQIAGRLMKFNHQKGTFFTDDNGEAVPENAEFIAICDETMGGWIRFNPGYKPDRVMGLICQGFTPPKRSELSNPELADTKDDPWQHHHMLPLQHKETRDLFTFSVVSKTGNSAIGNLLRIFGRKRRTDPHYLPVIRLRATGWQPAEPGAGYQYKPVLVDVGRADRNDAATPNVSTAAHLDDEIPFN